jgi:CRISPR-associated protein Cmr6
MSLRAFNLHRDVEIVDPDEFAVKLFESGAGHHGLRHERYFGQWSAEDPTTLLKEIGSGKDKRSVDPLHEWLHPKFGKRGADAVELICGNKDLIDEYARRRKRLIASVTSDSVARFHAKLVTPLAIGVGRPHPKENAGMTWHHTLGVPYLPGSGLKRVAYEAAARGWIEPRPDDAGLNELKRIFGTSDEGVGTVIFFDGLPAGQVTVTSEITTSHYKPYYDQAPTEAKPKAPGDWFKPNPVTFPVVAVGAVYDFAVLPRRSAATGDLAAAICWLKSGLEILGAGAKTGSAGLGHFVPLPD